MNFGFDDDQLAIKQTAKEFLEARYRPELVRELAGGGRGFTDPQWQAISELGWPGVMIDERHGGLGLGAVELIVIQEELGYALAPTPLLSSVAAGLILQAAGTAEQQQRWLPELASGAKRGALAVLDQHGGWEPDHSELELTAGRLTATKIAVADAATADLLIVAGADGAHFLVEAGAPGLTIGPQPALDPTRKLYEVRLVATPAVPLDRGREGAGDAGPASGDGAPASGDGRAERADGGIAHAYATIATALAAENVGIAQRTMEMAVAYAKERRQFDRPIGSFQAVAHRCAQMLLETEGARSLTYGAAWALDHDPGSALRAASMAKAYAGDAGYRVAASSLQVHGGIGFTWEHDLHFFLKRARSNAHAYGDSRWHRDRVISLAGL